MPDQNQLSELVRQRYRFEGKSLRLGSAMLNGAVVPGAEIFLPLSTANRHGLVAGATGTGKTKTLQLLAEGFSDAGVPVLLMDIKGDLSGLAAPGSVSEKIQERCRQLGIGFEPKSYPVELLSLSGEPGVRMRATVSEFGPVLLSRILGLNDTQGGVVALLFKYCDDNKLPLLDLQDFTKVLQFLTGEGKAEMEKTYGRISTASTGTILRKVIELQQQGGDLFFGEPSFEISDLMRLTPEGKGMISILRVADLQDRPKLFSTFMLQLLAELYAGCPEAGDLEKPKLVLFLDEAHLVFREASAALLEQIETVIRLIRSKGIGVYFCTQNPGDVPRAVLAQLGLKVQHALRAFTAADRKMIRQASENYPESEFYKTDELITQLGIGEALVTALDEKGVPTPLVHCLMAPPRSRMDILSASEISAIVNQSALAGKYSQQLERESAYEILNRKLESAAEQEGADAEGRKKSGRQKPVFDNPMMRQAGRTAASIITRALLGVLGIGRRSSRR